MNDKATNLITGYQSTCLQVDCRKGGKVVISFKGLLEQAVGVTFLSIAAGCSVMKQLFAVWIDLASKNEHSFSLSQATLSNETVRRG